MSRVRHHCFLLLAFFVFVWWPLHTLAQRTGPIKPSASPPAAEKKDPAASKEAAHATSEGALDPASPPVPAEEIIQKFAAKEAEFRAARDNYTYSQSIRFRDFDNFGAPGGEFRRESDIVFTPEGRRYEKVNFEPPATLKFIGMSREDYKSIESVLPFVLTTEDLPKYNVTYQGRQQLDELRTYVFLVTPKRIEPGQIYFEGTIWVDDQDLQIVKTYGKSVPDYNEKGKENLFPKFETYREQIDGKYWFPTLTRADDKLRFRSGDVRILITIRYSNYKQFRSTSRILPSSSPPPQTPPETKPPRQ